MVIFGDNHCAVEKADGFGLSPCGEGMTGILNEFPRTVADISRHTFRNDRLQGLLHTGMESFHPTEFKPDKVGLTIVAVKFKETIRRAVDPDGEDKFPLFTPDGIKR